MAMGFLRKHLSIVTALGICVVASSALPGGAAIAYADSLSHREYRIKAAFLYNFIKFVEWPADRFADEGTPIILCVIGKDPFGTTLEDTVAGKIVKGRHIGIRRIDNVDDLDACHLLFVGSSERERLWQIVASSHGANVLTVGDMDDFVEFGGIINLTKSADKIRFQINLAAAKKAQLKLDLKLLKLASSVTKN
jgi:hypothetical protein